MAELQTPDGEQVEAAKAEVNARFDATMNDDAPAPASPPRKERPAGTADTPATRGKRTRQTRDDKPRTSSRAAAVTLTDEQRHKGAKSLTQVTAGVALIAAKATGNMAFAADAVAITDNGDALADACVETANASPAFAAALDKVCAAGPYAALIGVGVAIVSQLARNHVPSLAIPGTVHPAKLLELPAPAAQAEELAEAA